MAIILWAFPAEAQVIHGGGGGGGGITSVGNCATGACVGTTQTWGAGTTITWTYDGGATDCTQTWGNNVSTFTCGTFTLVGNLLATSVQALLRPAAGAIGAGTAPLKFVTGALNTTAEAGAIEFVSDLFYGTITTGAARRSFVMSPEVATPFTLAAPGAANALLGSDGTNWTRVTSISLDDSAAQFYNVAAPTKLVRIDASGLTAGETAVIKPVGAYTLTYTLTGATGVTLPTTGTLSSLAGTETLSNKTITGTSAKFTGDLTGLSPSVVITTPSGTDSASTGAAFLTHADDSSATNAKIGMTLYNITDVSSCTVTASTNTTTTCTLAGGSANHWDSGNAYQLGPGPSQSGSVFYVAGDGTIRWPATAGYNACIMADGVQDLDIDMASDTMTFSGTLDANVETTSAGHYLTASHSTTDDYICLHNKSATVVKGLGKRGTWTKEASD
jgi:hypothetical protein